jgi:cytochrome c-type biogenesis protein CcmF
MDAPPLLGFAPGTVAIWAALLAGGAATLAYLYAWRLAPARVGIAYDARRDSQYDRTIGLARRLYTFYAGTVVLASAVLMLVLLRHDFRVSYVASYSGRDLPFRYLLSTFWAGQEGSFLLWLFWGALIGLVVLRTAKEQEPAVMVVYLATFLGIVIILVKQSPFHFLAQVPPDGQGLNPLLQDPWMVIHPPVMFSGFASLSVPFAFAIAALFTKRWDGWVVRAMPWALFTFITLGTAILMGGYWAYKTLGWGGYWGWDPVENTSLVPWLATAALVHGMVLQRSREKHRKINLILAVLAFCCILYGTFLTRSGVLADFSVHSFVDLGITGWLVAIIAVFLVGGLGLVAFRWKEIPRVPNVDTATGKEKEEPFLSRSVLFILSVTLFSSSGLVILLGTSAPIITRLGGKPSQVATSFYNVTHAPIAILIGLLMGLVPFLSWRGETLRSVVKKGGLALGIGILGTGVAFAAGARGARDLLLILFAGTACAANLETIVLFVKRRAVATMGGYLAHVGTAIMLVGILVSGVYERKQTVTLTRGEPTPVGRHTMTFVRTVYATENGAIKRGDELDPAVLSDRRAKQAMEVQIASPSGKVWKAYPKMYVNQRTNQLMANPDVDSSPLMDLYVSPQSYDPGSRAHVEGTVLGMKKGESKTVGGVGFKFLDFEADRSQVSSDRPRVTVTAHYLVTTAQQSAEQIARFVMFIGPSEGASESPETGIPGTAGRFRIRRVSATEGTSEIEVLGLNPAGDLKPATPESFSMDVTTKPLISLVWGGFYVMMAGALLALVRRGKETRRAAATA